jgi:tetratricopeptide (TPR) repeat protein
MSTEAYKTEIISEEFTESRSLLSHLCREGRNDEARAFINAQQGGDLDRRVWAVTNLAYIAWSEGKLTESLRMLLEIEPLAFQCKDSELKAKFHLGLANTLEEIAEREGQASYFDRALIELEAARYYFENHRDIGCVENNIGNLKIKVGRAIESHDHLSRARQIFQARDDDDKVYRLAEIDNTEAESYLSENNPQEAVHFAQLSVDALRYGDEPKTLERSIETLEKALQALKDYNRAQLTGIALREAGSVAKAAARLGISRTAVEKRIRNHPELEEYARRGERRGVHAKKF